MGNPLQCSCLENPRDGGAWGCTESDTTVVTSQLSSVTLWAAVCQAPLSMGFSRQEYWSELPCSSPWDGEGNGTLLQYSCLENPMDGGSWKAAVHGVAEGLT